MITRLSPQLGFFDACTLLLLHCERGLVRLVKRLLYRKPARDHALGTVLVFRSGRLGDFLNAVPALALLRSRLPQARIVLATTVSSRPSMQSLTRSYADLTALPWVELVTPSLADRAVCFSMSGPDRGLASVRQTLADEQPDAFFVLPYMGEPLGSRLKKLLFFRLAGFRGPIFGFDALPSRGSLQHRQFQLGLYEHAVLGPVRAVSECSAIGAVAESELVQRVSIPGAALDWARSVLRDAGVLDTMIVAMAPGATFAHKVWPLERYIECAQALCARYDCHLLVVGSEAEHPLGVAMARRLGSRALDMTGKTTVTRLAALLSHCRLFVGNDSGAAHLASAVGCPAVTVTSALDFPGMWEPWNSRHGVARVRIECEYCLALTACPLRTNACIQAVAMQEVFRLCAQVLGPGSSPARPTLTAIRPEPTAW